MIRIFLTSLIAAGALSLTVATANASRSFSVINNTLLTYAARLTIAGSGSGNRLICNITLTASIHSAFAKVRGSLLGFVNGGSVSGCINNLGTTIIAGVLAEHRRPWHITLESFRGTLPRITEILFLLHDIGFLTSEPEPLSSGRLRCLYGSDIAVETAGRTGAAEYTIERFSLQSPNVVPLVEDGLNEAFFLECASQGEAMGTFSITLPAVFRLL
jgi:hypothetical protein